MKQKETPQPRVINDKRTEGTFDVDPAQFGDVMLAHGTSEELIEKTTVYIDPVRRLSINGIAYPRQLGRLRHIAHPELRNAPGPIVRISTNVRGKDRTEEQMNRTAVHEFAHIAQHDRKDKNIKVGNTAIWGLALAGAYIGNKLPQRKKTKAITTIAGAVIGKEIGYRLAPHERQARSSAHKITTSAIKRKAPH